MKPDSFAYTDSRQCVSQACVLASLRRIGLDFGRKMTHSNDRILQDLYAKS